MCISSDRSGRGIQGIGMPPLIFIDFFSKQYTPYTILSSGNITNTCLDFNFKEKLRNRIIYK